MNATLVRSRPVRVVIVDDTYDLRELLRLALTRGGMEVVGEAGDGLAGIEVVRAERPDVVLLDLSMPVMDGLEALPSIRRLIPQGKIIVLSGFGATQMSERALDNGADGYLQKGMSLKRILEYVRDIVEGTTDQKTPSPALTLVPPSVPPEPGHSRVAPAAGRAGASSQDVEVLRRAIAATAHQIRGPVAVLCGIAESIIAAGDEMSDAQRSRLMSSVTRQARVLDGITADLLTAAELQRGSLRLDVHAVEPIEVIDSVINARYLATVNAVVQDEREVLADKLRLEQMLGNLVGNALKYGRAPFEVGVRAAPEDDRMVAIDVTDSGDGVPGDFRDQLFREFTRAGASVATGTGLGLYVVRSLAEAHGGSVSYRPSASGGACFTLVLPAV